MKRRPEAGSTAVLTRPAPTAALAPAAQVDGSNATRTSAGSVADRRRLALERMHGGPGHGPETRAGRRQPRVRSTDRPGVWDVQHGPAPVAYYVIGIVVAVFVMLGLVMVLSASAAVESAKGNSPFHIFNRQVTWAGIGLIGMLVGARMHLTWVRRLAIPLVVLAGIGMALPFVPGVGSTLNDARAWVTIGSFSVQPSEFLKLALVVFAADLLVRRQEELSDVRRSLRPIAIVATCAAGACLAQGDLGSAIVMCAIVLSVAFIGGVPLSPMLATAMAAGIAALGFVFSTEYRYDRFTAFLDITGHRDRLSYQTYQGFLSIADGGLTGSGVGAGNGKLGYLPLAHSDFIFAVIADELGLVGSVAVVGGFMLLSWFGIQAALAAPDRFGMLLAGGITTWFGVQAVINLGGVTGLMPVTGLTLPFFSAGGSSLFVSMTAAGLLLNVARRAT
ncbi:MAG: putative lipid II flippase FtsW [Ilumatobacteraceae bacterium]